MNSSTPKAGKSNWKISMTRSVLFFVFENYLREFIVEVLAKDGADEWYDKVPKDVKDEVARLEATEEIKSWMALGSRDKSALMTLP